MPVHAEPVRCWFTIPAGERADCAVVAIPARGNRAPAHLPIAVLRSTASLPAADPVLFIEGGPGVSPFGALDATDERMDGWWAYSATFRRSRDFILFDPRGVGRARPSADCPELDALLPAPARGDTTATDMAAVSACARRLAATGIDPGAFTTPLAADDALAVVDAVGADRVNLVAVSYGTRVALEILRRGGGPVRAVVLDGVYPPMVNAREEQPWLARRAFRRLFDDCTASRTCRALFPGLERRVVERIQKLATMPVRLAVTDGDDWPPRFRLTAGMMVAAALDAMAEAEALAELPALLDAAARGRYERLLPWVPRNRLADADAAEGVAFAIECRETVGPADEVKLAESVRRFPPYGVVLDTDPGPDVCTAWPAERQDVTERLAVASPVPALLLSGAYDAVTPPDWGEAAAATLARSRHLVFRGAGHIVSFAERCANEAAARFVEEPDPTHVMACPEASRAPVFTKR